MCVVHEFRNQAAIKLYRFLYLIIFNTHTQILIVSIVVCRTRNAELEAEGKPLVFRKLFPFEENPQFLCQVHGQ